MGSKELYLGIHIDAPNYKRKEPRFCGRTTSTLLFLRFNS